MSDYFWRLKVVQRGIVSSYFCDGDDPEKEKAIKDLEAAGFIIVKQDQLKKNILPKGGNHHEINNDHNI